jgi:hypothetical protein
MATQTITSTISPLTTRRISRKIGRNINILDLPTEIAMDSSGSMYGNRWDCSATLIRCILGKPNPSVISWNHVAGRRHLDHIHAGGGTDPTMFMPFVAKSRTLIVTTDGEFDRPYSMVDLIRKSEILHVIAIFIGERYGTPDRLNLSVFGPLMEVPGVFVLCHYDGTDLAVLLQRGGNLPVPPEEITSSLGWSAFPRIRATQLTQLIGSAHIDKVQLGSAEVLLSDGETVLNIPTTMKNAGVSCFHELDALIHREISVLIDWAKNGQSEIFRQFLQAWYRLALADAEQNKETESYTVTYFKYKSEAESIFHRIRNETVTPEQKERYKILTKLLFEIGQKIDAANARGRQSIDSFYSQTMRDLSQPNDYTLAGLSRKNRPSNRALRASKVSNDALDVQKISEKESFRMECEICAENRTCGILASEIPSDQITANTNDFALNDPTSLGIVPANQQAIAGLICVPCADLLRRSGMDNPFTRQKIVAILPMVNFCQGSNLSLLAVEISKTFFGGKKLSIEMQMLLGLLFALEPSARFPKELHEFLYREILFHSRGNFTGIPGASPLPLLDAMMTQVLTVKGDWHRPITLLEPLRNRSLYTLVTMICMALRFKPDCRPLDSYRSVLVRLLAKILAGRILVLAKKDRSKFELFREVLETDLFDCSTGMPLRGTERLISLHRSRALCVLFDLDWFKQNFIMPVTRYAEQTGISVESILTPELITLLLMEVSHRIDTGLGEEDFIADLMQKTDGVRAIFEDRPLPNKVKILQGLSTNHVGLHRAEGAHKHIPQFSPLDLAGAPVTFCASCGESFLQGRSVEDLKCARNAHFKQVFHTDGESIAPTKGSSNINLHRAVRNVALAYPGISRPTRRMVLEVLIYLKRRKKGNLYESDLLEDIVVCLWDFLQKCSETIPTPLLTVLGIEDRMKNEIRRGLFPQVMIASMDGLTAEEISMLTAPLIKTIREELDSS